MTKEESMLGRRLIDLSKQSYNKGIVTYSDFLNLNEQSIFHTCKSELYTEFLFYGGYDYAERQMIAFLPDAFVFSQEYPIVCCKIEPLNHKFADVLNHRDVLGSLMNLGIERCKLGDILLKENQIYVFCSKHISEYIRESLTRIRHTSVQVEIIDPSECPDIRPDTISCDCIVTSLRLDGLLSAICKLSRSQSADLIKRGNVFVNGKEILSSSYTPKDGEILSVRGIGRFRFIQALGETKKGRIKVQYEKYV